MFRSIQKQVEDLLETELAFGAADINLAKWRPNPDLKFFQAYIRIGATREHFQKLALDMGLYQRGQTPEADMYLPASWACDMDDVPSWWHPTAETPADAAARQYGVNGWVVAKYENGAVFIIVTDTGSESGTPGPW